MFPANVSTMYSWSLCIKQGRVSWHVSLETCVQHQWINCPIECLMKTTVANVLHEQLVQIVNCLSVGISVCFMQDLDVA